MLRRLAFTIYLVFIFFTGNAQNQKKELNKNAFYIELGGNGYFKSINYERVLVKSKNNSFFLSGRVGFGYFTDKYNYLITTVPAELSCWGGKSPFKLEFGIGYTPSFGRQMYLQNQTILVDKNFDYRIFFRLGMRYQLKGSRIILKAGLTPLLYRDYYDNSKIKISPWGGIAGGIVW